MYSRDLLYKEIQNSEFEIPFLSESWVNSLPLIICGPILRKVYYDHISVWLAFKEEVTDIKLAIFDPKTPSVNIFKETRSPLVKLGRNLFVTLATATVPAEKLISDIIYGYNITFTHEGKNKQLKDSGVLKDGLHSIAYNPYQFPTFCLPSDDINNLKIVHGSCRMPHGGKTDALRAVDTMIEVAASNAKQRPQLLFLTGDQIYADEVADSLLSLIQKAASKIFGWEERLPPAISLQLPGFRKQNVIQAGFTTEDTKSHLITFQEYLLMYLFSFSGVLWPDTMPGFTEVVPNHRPKTQDQAKHLVNLRKAFEDEKKGLQSFIKCLPFVRKALANISTLMIFDDHEVTDDWHLDKKWNNNVLKNPLGRRIILNGLLTYSIFQDWGNDYAKYLSGKNLDLLNSLNEITNKGYPNDSIHKIEKIIVPQQIEEKDRTTLKSDFNWHYRIDYNSFYIFCLDTRTKRAYIKNETPLGSLAQNIATQFGSKQFDANKLLILISAAPVFGNVPLEIGQAKLREGNLNELTGIASRIEGLTGMYAKDQEAWIFSTVGFEALLDFLTHFKKTIILSGDVHHSLTSYIRLYRKNDQGYKLSEIVQVTSSGLKRTTESYHYPSINKYGLRPKIASPYSFIKILSVSPRQGFPMETENKFYDLDDIIFKNVNFKFTFTPKFQYIVKFIRSSEKVSFNFPKTQQEKVANFVRNSNEVNSQKIAVGKDNISLISFASNAIINRFWYANGDEGAPSDKESSNLLLPFTTHKIEFNSKINENELPVNTNQRLKSAMKTKE